MNPETRKFEPLDTPAKVAHAKRSNWPQFQVSQHIILRGIDFTIDEILPDRLVLRVVPEAVAA